MSRIPSSQRPPDAAEVAQNTETQEREAQREEASAALSGEESFYAGTVLEDTELSPRLRGLRLQVPQMRHVPTVQLLGRGLAPELLQAADLATLREVYGYLHDHHPQAHLTHDVELAWVSSVESRLASASRTLKDLAHKAQQVNRGGLGGQAFFDAWDRGNQRLRAVSVPQLAAAEAHATMAPHETAFYRACLAALDTHALAVAQAKASFQTPDEPTLRHLARDLYAAAALATLPLPPSEG